MREVIAYRTDKNGRLTHVAIWVPATKAEKQEYQQEVELEAAFKAMVKHKRKTQKSRKS